MRGLCLFSFPWSLFIFTRVSVIGRVLHYWVCRGHFWSSFCHSHPSPKRNGADGRQALPQKWPASGAEQLAGHCFLGPSASGQQHVQPSVGVPLRWALHTTRCVGLSATLRSLRPGQLGLLRWKHLFCHPSFHLVVQHASVMC